jgi:hypothetical protein
MFAHTLSESLAISLIKVIFVAKKLFAAYFISSAVCQSVFNTGIFLSIKYLYTSFTLSIVLISSKSPNQKTILSGAKKSLIASHSLKNSGFETTLFFLSSNSNTFLLVQTGTVDFNMIISSHLRCFFISSHAQNTYPRSVFHISS